MDTTESKKTVTKAQADVERWEEETLAKVLTRSPERKASFEGVSLEPVNRIYTAADTEDISEIVPAQWELVRVHHY